MQVSGNGRGTAYKNFYVLDVKISEFNGSQMSKVVEFDTAVSNADRSRFLEYLFKDANVRFCNDFYLGNNIQMYKLYLVKLMK